MNHVISLIQRMVLFLISACTFYAEANPLTIAEEVRAFRDLKYGMFVHYSLSTFDGKEQTPGSSTPASIHNPANLDVDQWIRVAKTSGMKYAVLTAKHSSGFCLWDSKVKWKGKEFDYDVAASPVKTDIVAAFMAACKTHGIVPGMYYCAMDTRHSGKSLKWTPPLPYISDEYYQLMQDHLTELHSTYPSIKIQWIDIPRHLTSEQRTTLYNLVRNLNQKCLVMYNYGQESRDIKGEYTIDVAMKVSWPSDIFNSEITPIKKPFKFKQEYNGTTYELAYEHCISLDKGWFWDKSSSPKPLDDLIAVWNQTRSLNGNLLLNVPPDKAGRIPEAFIQRLNALRVDIGIVSMRPPIRRGVVISGSEFILNLNYLNPLNPYITIDNLNRSSNVILRICNFSGQEMETVVYTPKMADGPEITWQPKGLPSGRYILRMQVDALPAGPGQ